MAGEDVSAVHAPIMEKPRTRPSAAALFGLTAVLALAITGTAVWRTTGGYLPGIMGKSGQPDPDAALAMPANGGQPDMRFHMASPWDVAQVPKAVKFDFPAGTESGGFLHGGGGDFSGIGGPNTSLGDPVFAVADGQVAFVGEPSPEDGLTVVVRHTGPDGGALRSIYSRLHAAEVKVGSLVARGEKLGSMGTANGHHPAGLRFTLDHGGSLPPVPGGPDVRETLGKLPGTAADAPAPSPLAKALVP